MTRADIFAGLLLAAGFGALLWEASSFQYGTEFAPGPGFAPIWYGALGVVLSLLVAVNAVRAVRDGRHQAEDGAEALEMPGLLRVVATLVGLAAMLAIVPWLGLLPSILVFLLFLTLGVQRLSLPVAIPTSVATVLFIYVVFVHLLGVPVESGPLGF
jgi:putative tricarboxylic transport membrane protein